MDFLIKHKLINPSQHEFLKARSCLTKVLCFLRKQLIGLTRVTGRSIWISRKHLIKFHIKD